MARHPEAFVLDGDYVTLAKTTPHWGDNRVCGEYRCLGCRRSGRRWASGHSWADAWQRFKGCESKVFPYAQYPLKSGGDFGEERGPHDAKRRSMCLRLGRPCS